MLSSAAEALPVFSFAALYFAGYAGLPWLWIINVWLFWPTLRSQRDPVIMHCAPRPNVLP